MLLCCCVAFTTFSKHILTPDNKPYLSNTYFKTCRGSHRGWCKSIGYLIKMELLVLSDKWANLKIVASLDGSQFIFRMCYAFKWGCGWMSKPVEGNKDEKEKTSSKNRNKEKSNICASSFCHLSFCQPSPSIWFTGRGPV